MTLVTTDQIEYNARIYKEAHPEVITGFKLMTSPKIGDEFWKELGTHKAGTYVGTNKCGHVYIVHDRVEE